MCCRAFLMNFVQPETIKPAAEITQANGNDPL